MGWTGTVSVGGGLFTSRGEGGGVFAHAYGPRTSLMHTKGSASHYTALQTKSTHFPLRPQKRGVLLRTGTGDGVGVERAGKKD